jgi:GntR family transcriptional regulator/MocR family aminotransferase
MENPGYPGLRDILAQTRCKMRAVDVDGDGLPPERLRGDEDVVFVTPSHHCPTGATMPLSRRTALLDRARRDGFLIVEDDYEFEIAPNDRPAPALKSLDTDGRVVYLGSMSKSVFPGLRIGYLVGAPPFIREARALRALTLRHPPGHLQRTAAYFLTLGHYDAQVRRMTRVFAERRAALVSALAAEGLAPPKGDLSGGSSLWMRAPAGVDTAALARRLRGDGVLIEPGEVFFGPDAGERRHYRLAYSSIATDRIAEGVARIAAAMARA